ncbi:hypothetical protein A1O3_09228 [Capronia epimyces CBS 606.96]|uniref:DUF3752 domain-containing protein n=1 Tax=Capronia epimyces CBS 606.96 TaxID=1182542 RepID=W9XC54_9EURO|nr:uncharacterized protein A1O3_09228 [Capronia epimyces CBS 606.96]EXJ78067.1 hypothetical protein A1O3_09228 [Capronia epimyces CBS 606.96]
MSSVGPQLPPGLQKRKRDGGEDHSNSDDDSDSSTGPLPPNQQGKGREQSPPSTKRTRVIGPTLPPAPLDERPSSTLSPSQARGGQDDHESSSSSDDDDGFGPSLPSASAATTKSHTGAQIPGPPPPVVPAKRDEWMTLAPTGGDWSARVDPTKLKNRKFNTGRGAKAAPQPAAGGESWHETPEEKQARLKREVMGIKDPATAGKTGTTSEHGSQGEATARRLKEYNATLWVDANDKQEKRGPSLYSAHSAASTGEEEDDPSARAFDREKDIAGGATINPTRRREMLKKATDFSSRFSSARYL